jgi:hypothetical protein
MLIRRVFTFLYTLLVLYFFWSLFSGHGITKVSVVSCLQMHDSMMAEVTAKQTAQSRSIEELETQIRALTVYLRVYL